MPADAPLQELKTAAELNSSSFIDRTEHGAIMSEKEEFPEVQGGGSLILAWQIKGKKVLVVGGGEVSFSPWSPSLLASFVPSLTDDG